MKKSMNIYLAKARGFCMGVERSISTAKKARARLDGEITILNEIVHNNSIVADLERRGICRTTDPNKVKSGTLIISAHGVAPAIIEKARDRGLNVIDSTCPLVTVLHKAADYFIKRNYTIIVLGDPDHDEMRGVKGRNPDKIIVLKTISSLDDLPEIEGKVALISQSTQSLKQFDRAIELVLQKYEQVEIKNTICEATRKRQAAIIELAPKVELVIVVGSPTSANSRRLVEISRKIGTKAYLIDQAKEIKPEWLVNVENVGVTAGASTPDGVVSKVVQHIRKLATDNGCTDVRIYDDRDEK